MLTILRNRQMRTLRVMSLAAAMTSARRERIAAGAPAAAWSGLIVMGDGETVPFAGIARSQRLTILPAGGGLLLFGLCVTGVVALVSLARRPW